jgi:hypothetical protein
MAWTASAATPHCASLFSATAVFVCDSSAGYFTILFNLPFARQGLVHAGEHHQTGGKGERRDACDRPCHAE